MESLYFIFLGISPAVFCLWYFYKKDKWEPEPKWQVTKIFLLGIVAVLPAVILENLVQKHFFLSITNEQMTQSLLLNLTVCFLVIAPIEEVFKHSVVKSFIYNSPDFNEKVDGVVYMVAAAMGFAGIENAMYILKIAFRDPGDPELANYYGIMRGLLATPAHAIFSGFLGVYLGKAKFAGAWYKTLGYLVAGFVVAILLHGIYNTLVFSGRPFVYAVVPFLVIAGYVLFLQVRKLVDESPFKPKEAKEEKPLAK